MQIAFSRARMTALSGAQMHEILQAREAVFVVEQNCPYQDADECDQHAWHLTGRVDGKLACYARLVDAGVKYPQPSIGRVLTSAAFRGMGLGRRLMQQAIRETCLLYPQQDIQISAQAHLHDFYQSLGFLQISDEYLEDDIAHILMLLRQPADNIR